MTTNIHNGLILFVAMACIGFTFTYLFCNTVLEIEGLSESTCRYIVAVLFIAMTWYEMYSLLMLVIGENR